MKIQFCSGSNLLPGFLNTDLNAADGLDRVDITKPLPFAHETVDFVFCEHGFEHITATEALHFLDECFRIMKSMGTIRLCIPVLERIKPEHARDIITGHGHLGAYSTQLIKDFLRTAGFVGIRETDRRDIDSHYRVIGTEKDSEETARVEAEKP